NLADENCIVHFYGYLFDLTALSAQGANAIAGSRAKTVVTIGDHPFSTFMHGTVRYAHPKTTFIVADSTFQDELTSCNPGLAGARFHHQPIQPPTNYDKTLVSDFKSRSFDLVIPMFITNMAGHGIKFILSQLSADWLVKTMVATYELSMSDVGRNPFHIFHECLQANVGLSFAQIRDGNPKIVPQLLTTVAAVDATVRQERRQKMLNALLRDTGDLKVAVTCDAMPALAVDSRVTFLGARRADDISRLMADSRAVLNCNPSYPSSLHERVVSGMLYGSCVISDVNRSMSELFSPDVFVPYAVDSVMTIVDIYSYCGVEDVAAAGARKISNDASFSWDGHIDRLLHAAAA
ncbi:MAG: hypothetical protein K2P94_13860, partial [Rhodospirillaceae bacterium]|nr:hypothetical protein [Rhodospirillaceae bacterium]